MGDIAMGIFPEYTHSSLGTATPDGPRARHPNAAYPSLPHTRTKRGCCEEVSSCNGCAAVHAVSFVASLGVCGVACNGTIVVDIDDLAGEAHAESATIIMAVRPTELRARLQVWPLLENGLATDSTAHRAVYSRLTPLNHCLAAATSIRSSAVRDLSPIFTQSELHLCVEKKRLTPSNPLSVAPFLCLRPVEDT